MSLIAIRYVLLSAPYVKVDSNYQTSYSAMMTSHPVPSCDIYRPMIENRTRASCHFETKNLPQLDGSWIRGHGTEDPSPSPPQGHFWMTRHPEEQSLNFPSCEYQMRNEPMDCSQSVFLPLSSVQYLTDCNLPYHITTPVKQEIYHPANSLFGYCGQSPDGLNSYSPSNGCMGAFLPPEIDGYRSLHQPYSPEFHNYYGEPTYVHHSPTLYGPEMVSPFLLDPLTVESTLSELDPAGVEEELRNLAQSSTDSFEHHEMLSVSSRLSCKEECSQSVSDVVINVAKMQPQRV